MIKARNKKIQYLNQILDKQIQKIKDKTPTKQQIENSALKNHKNTDHSLSFSITQKDSNVKNFNDFDFSNKSSGNKYMKKSELETLRKQQQLKGNNVLTQQLMLLQSKLSNLQQKFLNMSTPEKVDYKTKVGKFKKNKGNNPNQNKQLHKKNTQNSTKRKDINIGKIQSTTRFSVADRRTVLNKSNLTRNDRLKSNESKQYKNTSFHEDKSIGSLRSVQKSKNKEFIQLKKEVDRFKQQMLISKRSKETLEKKVQSLSKKVNNYKDLQKKYVKLQQKYQNLISTFQKSEIIREKQKKLLIQYQQQIKSLKKIVKSKK